MGRFNRLLRWGGALHLTSLFIHMAPDDVEHSRMQVLELRGLRLVELSLHHSAFFPLLLCHPTSPRVALSWSLFHLFVGHSRLQCGKGFGSRIIVTLSFLVYDQLWGAHVQEGGPRSSLPITSPQLCARSHLHPFK
jgi:hypothetical protein